METIVITLVAIGAVGWLAFMVASTVRGRGKEEVPPNLAVFKTDEELESSRLEKVQAAAVVVTAFLAVATAVYYLSERNRQVGFEEEFAEAAVERGHELYEEFACGGCHGVDGGGGAAPFVDARSGVSVSWAAPAINDVLYRYSPDEVRFWLVYGRPNSPMPAWGLDGGGPMNSQQIDDLVAYLDSIQIDQIAAVEKVEANITAALSSLDNAETTVANTIEGQELLIEVIEEAPAAAAALAPLVESAQLALAQEVLGIDADADGLADAVEAEISALTRRVAGALSMLSPDALATLGLSGLETDLDPTNPESTGGQRDLRTAISVVATMESALTQLETTVANQEKLLVSAQEGLAFLEASAEAKAWEVDIQAIADSIYGGDLNSATRAVGLFNAYCARCHTSSYSAGPAFTLDLASGAFGPALNDGRVRKIWNTEDEMVEFLIKGQEFAAPYGINGVGNGWMPGFGFVLSEGDIRLIAQLLRGMPIDAP